MSDHPCTGCNGTGQVKVSSGYAPAGTTENCGRCGGTGRA
jgi:DnaJ-class molecular chaperone